MWWRCARGHEWETAPNNRVRNGKVRLCPYCSGARPIRGETDFATQNPELIKEWAYDLNPDIDPTQVLSGSDKKVWWRCIRGHEWETRINYRTLSDRPCPVCFNNMVYIEEYCVANFPDILALWDWDRNKDISPENVYVSSIKKFQWICKRKHRWTASAQDVFKSYRKKVMYGNTESFACIKCAHENASNRETLPTLAQAYCHLIAEWDWDKNKEEDKNPSTLTAGSDYDAWWLCRDYHHSWKTRVRNRVKGSNCPYCGNKKLLKGFNDLQTVNPELAFFWHPDLNGDLKPQDILATSHRKVHWLCPRGHHSFTSPSAKSFVKTDGFSCLRCHNDRKHVVRIDVTQ